jgi:hypothetical protein
MHRYSGADVVSDFRTESSIVHQENVKIAGVSDEELFKAVGEMESGFFIVSVTDFWHGLVASESSSHSVVDTWSYGSFTSWSSPAGSQSSAIKVGLEASESGGSLMFDSLSEQGC